MAFDIGSVVAHIKADLSEFTSGLNQAKSEMDNFGQRVGGTIENIRGFAEKAGLVVAGQTLIFKELASEAINVASNFEQTQTSFGTLLGSEQKAADLMKEIMQFEIHTPFDIQTLTNGAKAMLAFGVNAKNVVPIMSELTDMSQGQSDKLNELISIYGQVNSIQQLNGREVLRLSSIGIPIYQAIEDHFKKIGDTSMQSGEEVKKAISKGQISAEVFNQILSEMTSKGGLFFQENIRQMNTFSGIMSSTHSQLQYAILNLMGIDIGAANEVREGGLFATLREMAARLLDGLNKLQPIFKQIGENHLFQLAIEGMVIALASLAIIIPIVILALNPIVLVVALIEAAIVALYMAWNTNFLGIRDVTQAVVTEVINFFTNYLKPLIDKFIAEWKVNWPLVSSILKLAWDLMIGIIRLAWEIIYGILKIGFDILNGDWKRLWDDIKNVLNSAWNDLKNIFNSALSFIDNWGGQVVQKLVQPFQDAWSRISDLMNKIKSALDFTQRHSPSVIDIIDRSVDLANQALSGLAFNNTFDVNPQAAFSGALGGSTIGNNITISLDGAIIADSSSASRIGEVIGDSIIKKLQMNIRV